MKFLHDINGTNRLPCLLHPCLPSYTTGISYVFESLMLNEFKKPLECDPAMIVPFGQVRDVVHQTCAFAGSKSGSLVVEGIDYLHEAFGYQHDHLWRNFGVVVSTLSNLPTLGLLRAL